MLNWPRLIIFRFQAKMITNPKKSLRTHPKSPSQKVPKRQIFWKQMFRAKRFLQKWTSYGSSGRSAWGKILAHWSSIFHTFFKNWTFTTKKRHFTSSFWSRPQVFLKKYFFIWSLLWFISCRTYSLLRRVRHNSKIESKNDLLNTKCPKCHFSWEMTENAPGGRGRAAGDRREIAWNNWK